MEELVGLDYINSIIENSLKFYQNVDFDYYDIIGDLTNYIINHKKNIYIEKNRGKINIKKSINISKKFLSTIDEKYDLSLDSAFENKTILLNKVKKDNTDECAFCDFDDNLVKYIYIPYLNNSEDIYSFSHEIIHYADQTTDEITAFENSFCEVYSLLSELLLQDYLKENKKIKYISLNKKKMFNAIYQNAILVSFDLNLINSFKENGILTKDKLISILNNYTEGEKNILEYSIEYMQETCNMCFDLDHRYILGIFFASYMHNQILKNPKLLNEYYSVSGHLEELDIKQFIGLINLDCEEKDTFDLDNESYQKLYKAYQKELRRI